MIIITIRMTIERNKEEINILFITKHANQIE